MNKINLSAKQGGKFSGICQAMMIAIATGDKVLLAMPEPNPEHANLTHGELMQYCGNVAMEPVYEWGEFIGYQFWKVDCMVCKDTGVCLQQGYPQVELFCECELGRALMNVNTANEEWIDETWRKSGSWAAGLTGND